MPRILGCIAEEHHHWMVVLAAVICVAGSAAFIALAGQVRDFDRVRVLDGRAVIESWVLAHTVWTTHFVAMVGYHMAGGQTYDVAATVGSGAVMMAASLAAVVLKRWKDLIQYRVGAGLVFAAGASGMHYLGMAGVNLPGQMRLDPNLVGASVLIGAGFGGSAFALMARGMSITRRVLATVLLVAAIAGLHFTGMSAVTIYSPVEDMTLLGSDRRLMILVLVGMTLVMIAAALTAYLRNGPRLIWRRNAVAMGLLLVMVSTGFFLQSETRKNLRAWEQISALISDGNVDRAALDGYAVQQVSAPEAASPRKAPNEIVEASERLGAIAVQIREILEESSQSARLRSAYLSDVAGSDDGDTLFEDTLHFRELFWPFLRGEGKLSDLMAMRSTGIALRYHDFGDLVRAEFDAATEQSEREMLVVLIGFLLIFGYQGLGIALPGHRSVVQALDELEAQRRSAEDLADIARSTTDAVFVTDRGGHIKWTNPAFCKLLGREPKQIHGRRINAFLSEDHFDQASFHASLRSIGQGHSVINERAFISSDGEVVWVSLAVTPIIDADMEIIRVIHSARDITEQKCLQAELRQHHDQLAALVEDRTRTIQNQALELESALSAERELNRLQTEFVAMASHEFRTPLTIIDGQARRLETRADKVSAEDIRERTDSIRSAVKRMTMLVDRTLDASRLSSGRMKLAPASFNPKKLVEEVCTRQRELAPRHAISCDLSRYPETLFGDARLLDNVIANLLSNAVKYSPDRPVVEVTGWTEDGMAKLSVRDHGVGIPEKELPRIFERFFRASTSSGISGTGIGLNLVKSLVEMHHGHTTLRSKEGEWTEICVSLPLTSPLETSETLAQLERDTTSSPLSLAS